MTFDNEKVGELQAQFWSIICRRIERKRSFRIYGAKTDNNALLYKRGQDKVLTPLINRGEIEVVHERLDAGLETGKRQENRERGNTKAGANFDAILASNDGTAGGAIQALSEKDLAGKILVTGQDAELSACQRIVNGHSGNDDLQTAFAACEQAAEAATKMREAKPVFALGKINNGKSTCLQFFSMSLWSQRKI